MEKIRIGNDIEVLWAIYAGEGVNEAPYDLTGKNLTLYLINSLERKEVYSFTVEKHIIKWKFLGKEQKHIGAYTMELVENEGREGMHTVDECNAFTLVRRSCDVSNDTEGRVECIHLQFRSSMTVGYPAIGAEMDIDSTLSLVSENPVQNKVITAAMQDMEHKLTKAVENQNSRLTLVEQSLELVEDSVQNLSIKVASFEDRLRKVEEGDTATVLNKVEELNNSIDILNADAETEGSVDNKIAQAFEWAEVQ